MAVALEKDTSAADLRFLIRNLLQGREEVSIPDLAGEVVDHVLADEEMSKALMFRFLQPMVYEQVRRQVASTRSDKVLVGDEVMSKDNFKKQATAPGGRFNRWLEHANGRHVRLVKMTKTDLLAACEERGVTADRNAKLRDFFKALSEKVPEGKTVAQSITTAELERIAAKFGV